MCLALTTFWIWIYLLARSNLERARSFISNVFLHVTRHTSKECPQLSNYWKHLRPNSPQITIKCNYLKFLAFVCSLFTAEVRFFFCSWFTQRWDSVVYLPAGGGLSPLKDLKLLQQWQNHRCDYLTCSNYFTTRCCWSACSVSLTR